MAGSGELKTEELTAIIAGIRDRVRARYPQGSLGSLNVPLPDLMPVLHARDAAEAKVAAIGKVNPRPPGPVNFVIQFVKNQVARALDWHVREQVEFNRAAITCVETLLTALNESNRALAALTAEIESGSRDRALRDKTLEEALNEALDEVRDTRAHWIAWRQDWERRLSVNETQFLRNVADLQSAFQHRAVLMESNYRDLNKTQHTNFTLALERSAIQVQERLWADMEKVRVEYERLIHSELRLLRLRNLAQPQSTALAAAPGAAPTGAGFDYLRFAERFRGSEEYVRNNQQVYSQYFQGRREVLDIGCGRGEFLETMLEQGVPARGIDLSAESVAICRSKNLAAEQADLFSYLGALEPGSLDGIFCAQVVEHLPPERVPETIRLSATALRRNGLLIIETPNPECLAIFATHFYLDPTHTKPIPSGLMRFYLEEAGFGNITVRTLSPAIESLPALASLPADFREAFFGGLDYAVIGTKL